MKNSSGWRRRPPLGVAGNVLLLLGATLAGDYPTRKPGSAYTSYSGNQQAFLDEKAVHKGVTVLPSGLMYKVRACPRATSTVLGSACAATSAAMVSVG